MAHLAYGFREDANLSMVEKYSIKKHFLIESISTIDRLAPSLASTWPVSELSQRMLKRRPIVLDMRRDCSKFGKPFDDFLAETEQKHGMIFEVYTAARH